MGISVFPVAASGGLIQKSQTFTSSGTFTLPDGYGAGKPLIISALVCGGGGGGGGGGYTTSASAAGGGGGGGSGVATFFENISLTANATITIGAGGTGGAGGGTVGTQGSSGGNTNINSTFYSPGGGGGGFGSQDGTGAGRGFSVNSFGYNIQGGARIANNISGGGGAGGSGGGNAHTQNTNPDGTNFYTGGSYGDCGLLVNGGGGALSPQLSLQIDGGSGVRRGFAQATAALTSVTMTSFVPDFYQPGGGGGGGYENTSPLQGQAGFPGTRIGGLAGYKNGTSKDAVTATTPGAGGGGGGASYNNGGRGGNGGTGAAGFVTIYWWG